MLKARLSLVIVLSTFFLSAFAAKEGPYNWPPYVWQHLDIGLYWVAPDNIYCKANPNQAIKKHEPSVCKKLPYDPNKPTMIFIHGWEPGSTYSRDRISFYYQPYFSNEYQSWDTAKAWLKKGWNVGIFYWNQLADENNVVAAEAKIWTVNGPANMRWKHYRWIIKQGNHYDYKGLTYTNRCQLNGKACPDVTTMLYNAYKQALKNYQGGDIRIVGHSLGGQLAIRLTKKIADNVSQGNLSPKLLPRRLTLLDPFFGPPDYFPPHHNNLTVQQVLENNVQQLINKEGILVEEYLSSDVTDDDMWGKIARLAAVTYYRPWFDWSWDEVEKHEAARLIYFLSMKDKPPREYVKDLAGKPIKSGKIAASASTPDLRIAEMMGTNYYWDQNCSESEELCGEYSLNTKNDGFLRLPKTTYQQQPQVANIKVAGANYLDNSATLLIANNTVTVKANTWIKLSATVFPKDAANKLLLWKTSNGAVAKVYPGGYVHLLQPGKATITAYAPGGERHSVKKNKQFVNAKININSIK